MTTSTSASVRAKLTGAAGLLAVVLVGLAVVAPAASAHHPEISFTVACGYTVEWTATSWSPGTVEGSNPDITVEYRVDGGAWQAVPNGSGAFTKEQPQFSGSFTAPGTPVKIQLRVKANADWENGVDGGQTVEADPQDFPTDCGSAEPHAQAAVDCAEGGVVVSVWNTGTRAITVDVFADGVVVKEDLELLPGTPGETVVVALAENGDVIVEVRTTEGEAIFSQSFHRDCQIPLPPGRNHHGVRRGRHLDRAPQRR